MIYVISLPHRSDDAIRQNADLSGRLSLINMEPWNVDELKEIVSNHQNEGSPVAELMNQKNG